MTERDQNALNEATTTPPSELELDWEREKTKVRVRQFMNILEQLPRLCSPTICGTLSQPTTRAERVSRGADIFEWSLEQKAILSPANITTDTDGADSDWQNNMADLNPSWRQQESEQFFSQRTIAPSPMITSPPTNNITSDGRSITTMETSAGQTSYKASGSNFQDLMYDDDDDDDDEDINDDEDDDDDGELPSEEDDNQEEKDNDEGGLNDDDDQEMDNLFFSPQPLKSSQTQQMMDIFSPESFVRVMEDENTLQSTPRTTGSSQRTRTRTRADVLD